LKEGPPTFYEGGVPAMQLWCSLCVTQHFVHRYLGLTFLVKTNDIDPRMQEFVSAEWASFLNPVALLWLYYILGIESYFLLQPRVSSLYYD